jgi:hypothetical protein
MKKPITTSILIALSYMLTLGCDRAPEKAKFGLPTSKGPFPEAQISNDAKAGSTFEGEKIELPLGLILPAGSAMRFLDAKALQKHYANVFSKGTLGYQHCAGYTDPSKLPYEESACHDSMFTAGERVLLGAVDINLNDLRGGTNLIPPENLTLNYLRTLRSALARECNVLVKKERANVKAGTANLNQLNKGASPTAADLEEFFRSILGIKGSPVKVDIMAADYVKAFETIVAAGGTTAAAKETAADQAYIGLCVAIGMNPQIIIY